jgi:hypothetical protein
MSKLATIAALDVTHALGFRSLVRDLLTSRKVDLRALEVFLAELLGAFRVIGDIPVAFIKPLVISAGPQLVIVLAVPITLGKAALCLIGILDLLSEARALALIVTLFIAVRAANGSSV